MPRATYTRITLAALALTTFATAHASFTLATFADPATSAATPLFTFDTANNKLAGGWSLPGLLLDTPGFIGGGQVPNATFTMTTLDLTPVVPGIYTTSGGQIVFQDSSSTVVLTIDFDAAIFVDAGQFGASTFNLHDVQFSGPNVPSGLSDEQFSFALANPAQPCPDCKTFTASFTSSAVPEPASLVALGLGLGALIRRRR